MKIDLSLVDLLMVSPMVALVIVSMIPILIKVLRGNREMNHFVTLIYSYIGILAAAVLAVTFILTESRLADPKLAFSGALIFDGVSGWTTLVVLFIAAFALILSRENKAVQGNQFSEYVFLLLNCAVGMLVVAWSNDLIITFIGIEVMSLCLYIMIAMSHEERLSKEAAFKYFVLGSFGSAIMLYGISLLYGLTEVTYINVIATQAAQLAQTNPIFIVAAVLVLVGFLFKVSIAPFHAWAPDVYSGSPTPVTALMATGVKAVSFVAFLRFMTMHFVDGNSGFLPILEWLAVITMSLGNFAALRQANFKRMLAYSSVAHSGYAMIGLIVASLSDGNLGASGLIFYLFAYSIMTLGAFGVVSLLEKKEDSIVYLEDLNGLSRRAPALSIFLTLFLLSLAGIPPTVGFFGKFFIFSAAIQQKLYWLSLWGVINSVVSVYYYLKPIVNMYMKDPVDRSQAVEQDLGHFALGLAAVLVVVVGVFADPFYQFIFRTIFPLY